MPCQFLVDRISMQMINNHRGDNGVNQDQYCQQNCGHRFDFEIVPPRGESFPLRETVRRAGNCKPSLLVRRTFKESRANGQSFAKSQITSPAVRAFDDILPEPEFSSAQKLVRLPHDRAVCAQQTLWLSKTVHKLLQSYAHPRRWRRPRF